jgi:EH_Signature domain
VSSLDDLSITLVQATGRSFTLSNSEPWGNPKPMSKLLKQITIQISRPPARGHRRPVRQAILNYRRSRELEGDLETKYVCIGAAAQFSQWCLLEDAALLAQLLKHAQAAPDQRRLRYFSYLLHGYWSYPRNGENVSADSRKGWVTLRSWLAAQQRDLARSTILKPLWFRTLTHHANLLTGEACGRYGQELLAGVSAGLTEALANLGVPSSSWVREEAIYALMQAAANLHDAGFHARITQLVEIATGETDLKLSRGISIRCVASLLSRYAASSGRPENAALRDAALHFIGNPWLHRIAWNSYVLDQHGQPDTEAREMVNSWLKVRLIKDFFDLLSEDRSADSRRLNYWLGFEPAIRDMWFALGADAMGDKREDYAEFRQRSNSRLLDLAGATPTTNNAFLMQIGDYVVIEFGITGNACFAYRYDDLPFRLRECLHSKTLESSIDIADLKAAGYEARLLHQGSWEPKFDATICPLVGFTPPGNDAPRWSRGVAPGRNVQCITSANAHERPRHAYRPRRPFSRPDFNRFTSQHALPVDDLLRQGGCLWVRTDAADAEVCESLKAWGFTYRHGKGWWRE